MIRFKWKKRIVVIFKAKFCRQIINVRKKLPNEPDAFENYRSVDVTSPQKRWLSYQETAICFKER